MWNQVVSEDSFMLLYCPNRYKTQKMCDEDFDDYLVVLKFISDWFVTSKMLEKFHDALLANDYIPFFKEDFSKVTFFANEIGVFSVGLDKINLHDKNNSDTLMKMILKLLVMSDLWLGVINLRSAMHLKKI